MTRKLRKEKEREQSIALQQKMERLNRRCRNKKAFDTDIQAWSQAKFHFKHGEYFRTYFCNDCKKWHITTKERY